MSGQGQGQGTSISGGIKVSSKSPVVLDVQREAAVGVNVSLHPLPILNISEHLTRTSMQAKSTDVEVYGALLGTQSGRDIDIHTTFEMIVKPSKGGESSRKEVDHEFLTARQAQFKQVFPTFDFLGWYSTGNIPTPADLEIHSQLFEYNESPLFLQLSPSDRRLSQARAAGELPIAIYETFVEIKTTKDATSERQAASTEAGPATFFLPANYRVETGEAERIAVDHTSKPPAGGEDGESSTIASLTTQYNAIKMLSDRISLITAYLQGVQSGTLKRDHESLRQISSLVASLPASSELPEFQTEFLTEYNDVLLTSYLANMTSGLNSLNELVDKFDTAQSGADESLGRLRGGGARGNRAGRIQHF